MLLDDAFDTELEALGDLPFAAYFDGDGPAGPTLVRFSLETYRGPRLEQETFGSPTPDPVTVGSPGPGSEGFGSSGQRVAGD